MSGFVVVLLLIRYGVKWGQSEGRLIKNVLKRMLRKAFMNFGKTRTKSTKRRHCEKYTKLPKREDCEAYTIFLNRSIYKCIRRYGCRLPSCLFCIRRLTAHNRLISCHFAPCLLYTECIHQFHCPIFGSQLMRVSCFATAFWLLNFKQWVIACMSPKLGASV